MTKINTELKFVNLKQQVKLHIAYVNPMTNWIQDIWNGFHLYTQQRANKENKKHQLISCVWNNIVMLKRFPASYWAENVKNEQLEGDS